MRKTIPKVPIYSNLADGIRRPLRFLPLALLLSGTAQAADKAMILSDQEQAAYRAVLDAAIRANGLSLISRNAFILSDKLDQAGVVTEHKDDSKETAK